MQEQMKQQIGSKVLCKLIFKKFKNKYLFLKTSLCNSTKWLSRSSHWHNITIRIESNLKTHNTSKNPCLLLLGGNVIGVFRCLLDCGQPAQVSLVPRLRCNNRHLDSGANTCKTFQKFKYPVFKNLKEKQENWKCCRRSKANAWKWETKKWQRPYLYLFYLEHSSIKN